jgi:PAS domain-containing protein
MTADGQDQSEAFYQLVLDSLPNQVAVVDRHGRTRFSNAAWRAHNEGVVAPEAERLMREGRYLEACEAALTGNIGASEESLGLMRVYLAALRNIIAGVRDEFSMEYEVPGQGRWFRVDRMLLLRPDGSISGIPVAYADITTLKRTDDALARQTAELKAS